jgi:hypothetical protein
MKLISSPPPTQKKMNWNLEHTYKNGTGKKRGKKSYY